MTRPEILAPPADTPEDPARRLLHDAGRAIADFGMIQAGDRILVAVSGGKDSYGMLETLRTLQRRAPVRFELVAVHLDQGQPGHDPAPLRDFLQAGGYEHEIVRVDTYAVVLEKLGPEARTYCSLCSRLRRGVLYTTATRLGCTRIALGHHRDDAIETLLLNLFFAGKLASMPAWLRADDGVHVVIRPMIYCAERTLARYADERRFPVLPCGLCGAQPGGQRQRVKALLAALEAEHPHLKSSIMAALANVQPSQLLDPTVVRRSGRDQG